MWGAVLSIIGGTFQQWVKSRSEIAEQKARARANALQNGIPGWSDEWLVIIWSLPFAACYIPGGGEYAAAALLSIDGLPDWYVTGFFTVTGAVFGLDKFIKYRSSKG